MVCRLQPFSLYMEHTPLNLWTVITRYFSRNTCITFSKTTTPPYTEIKLERIQIISTFKNMHSIDWPLKSRSEHYLVMTKT